MNKCLICKSGSLVVKTSNRGREAYCKDCRRINESATLGFKFAAIEPDPCKTEDGRPGFKGPGLKAVCHPYTNDEEKEDAKKKATESVYAFEHRRAATKLVNGTAYFTGLPAYASDGSQQSSPDYTDPQINPQLDQSPIGEVTAPGGMQPGELNGANPLNSGTTASKRLAELIQDDLGPGFCTEHMSYDECKHDK